MLDAGCWILDSGYLSLFNYLFFHPPSSILIFHCPNAKIGFSAIAGGFVKNYSGKNGTRIKRIKRIYTDFFTL